MALICLTIPVTVSWDGVLYISSGASLFTSNFPTWYLLMKEPGIPLAIWASLKLSNSLFIFVLFQTVLLTLSAALTGKILTILFKVSKRTSILLILAGSLMVRGYTVSVLQQMSFLFMYVIFLALILRLRREKFSTKLYFYFLAFGFFGTAISVAIPMISAATLLLGAVFFLINWKKVTLAIAVILVGSIFFALPWFNYTNSVDLSEQEYPSCRNSFCISGFKPNATILEKGEQIFSAIPALLYIGKETYYMQGSETFVAQTALAYGNPVISTSTSCIRLQEHDAHIYGFIDKYVTSFCGPKMVRSAQNLFSQLTAPLFPLFGYSYLFLLALGIYSRKKEILLLILPITGVLAAYSFEGTGISRYNPLLAYLGPTLIFLSVKLLLNKPILSDQSKI